MLASVSRGRLKQLATVAVLLISMVKELADCLAVDHCYSDIGCFPLSDEFYHPRHRPFNVRPWHRRLINTKFHLFNRLHPDGFELRPWNRLNLRASGFNPLLETKLIIPGWLDNIRRTVWVRKLKDSFLWLWEPVNVIVVQWRNFTPYTMATANTRVVGAEMANLLLSIEHQFVGYRRSYFHLIGHSLGAHISGYCGDRLPGLGRITALDPARPFFQHMPKSVRLDRGDANFVDAIHSDFTPENAILFLMSFGMTTPVGHVDFYPNGPPLLQPGCLRDTILSVRNGVLRGLEHRSLSIAFLETIRYLTACDHQRSHEWFIESITNKQCRFIGVRCNEFEGLINGRCSCDDSPSACAIMGIHADQMYLNNVHEDLWPVSSLANKFPSPPRPSLKFPPPPISGVSSREQLYSHLKQQASQLRTASAAPQQPVAATAQLLHGLLADESSEIAQDEAFMDYLRAQLLLGVDEAARRAPLDRATLRELKRRYDINEHDDLGLGNLFGFNGREQPKLMSDLDRDIENWYEGSSRWYLKTNNRPKYCVRQYQVLVFIGPLRTSNGFKRLRANLIISIIGSRGQLLNQRFAPRSSGLDSFTMQPFFILLEGSYSLGNIISVAVAWEFRHDPDPVKATVSFQSNILESFQSIWPTYKLKHPWLSKTIEYDHSQGFNWNPIGATRRLIGSDQAPTIGRRTGASASCFEAHKATGRQCQTSEAFADNLHHQSQDIVDELLSGGKSSLLELDELFSGDTKTLNSQDSKRPNQETSHNNNRNNNNDRILEELMIGDHYLTNNVDDDEEGEEEEAEDTAAAGFASNALDVLLDEPFAGSISAKLNNIGIHLGSEDEIGEDSIVLNQVIISPLEADYGRSGRKISRTFCPPRPGFRLGQDQTIKLELSLVGKCRHHHQYYQRRQQQGH